TLPTESAEPPENTAINATIISGKVVDIAISVKPTDVLPNLVIVETLTALVITRLLAQFKVTKAIAIIKMSTINWVGTMFVICAPLKALLPSCLKEINASLANEKSDY